MGDHPKGMDPASLPSLHMTMAQKVLGSDFEPEAILHSYKKSFNGFVIKLTEQEAEKMAGFYTTTIYPPWILSVAASTIDRKFITKVQVDNGMVFEGVSINTFDLKRKMFPMVYAGDVPNTADGYNSSISRLCYDNSVDKHLVKGKIVLCGGFQSIGHVEVVGRRRRFYFI
ncbi:hypothetical protein GLYMA_02G252302v4 [Glycine max]|nr:hypothetical protein GLYMA_02G252302v4 [Glycine max]KAH1062021.1 hypothetical protein GYH30_005165 [Glycine max]|eukprot:XP_014625246.1 cucumisin [Glycine max]